MKIVNATLFQFAPLAGRINHPKHSLTLIVKGTFDLMPDGIAIPAPVQAYPQGDAFYPDDIDMTGSCRYESDFAYYKPKADMLLAGHCHVPGGNPVPACRATFRVGHCSRSLYVFGDRHWTGAPGMRVISEPKPFTRMELRWENSFGGPGLAANPTGKGLAGIRQEPEPLSLPNIEDPEHLIDSPDSRPHPAGFGPLGRMWKDRAGKLGTYGKNYRQERWPWFPRDFDWRHCNAAPEQLQYEGYLRGDEPLFFEHLHPEHVHFHSRLPGVRVRCFLNRESDNGKTLFGEVSMRLDTLWADMDAVQVTLVWRGSAEVSSEEYDEVRDVFIMSEPVDTPAATIGECCGRFRAAQAQADAEWAMEPEIPREMVSPAMNMKSMKPPVGAAAVMGETAASAAAEQAPDGAAEEDGLPLETGGDSTVTLDPAIIRERAMAMLAQGGIDLKTLSPESRLKVEESMDSVISRMRNENPAEIFNEQQALLDAQLTLALSKLGLDTDNPPAVSEKARKEQARLLGALGYDASQIESGDGGKANDMISLLVSVFPKLGLDPENLTPLIDYMKNIMAGADDADKR